MSHLPAPDASVPMSRSVSVPTAVMLHADTEDDEADTTNNDARSQSVAGDGVAQAAPRLSQSHRLQSQAPPKLLSSDLSVPSSTLLVPASPMTPAVCGVPPNTPLQMGALDLSGEPVTPLYDQPFTPLPVPMSPMMPQPPPPSPFPQNITVQAGVTPSPLLSPQASPHPVRIIMNLPTTIGGDDVLPLARDAARADADAAAASEAADAPTDSPLPKDVSIHWSSSDAPPTRDTDTASESVPSPADADEVQIPTATSATESEEEEPARSVDATLEVEAPSVVDSVDPLAPEKLLLHRSRLGRLSIIHRDELAAQGLMQPSTRASFLIGASSGVPSPTAIANLSEQELVAHSKRHGTVVTSVKRVQHVTFDPNSDEDAAALANIPPEWREALKKQFGIPATLCQNVKLDGYVSRIPSILVRLHQYLLKHHTLETQVGIFRLAPDATECARLKQLITTNTVDLETVTGITDMPNCVANLIKVWFRDLPVPLFQPIPIDDIQHMTSATTAAEIETVVWAHLKEPAQSIYRWLVDLACDVTMHADTNKMIAKNVAICISPNLYQPPNISKAKPQNAQEALKIMSQCKCYTNFLELCIGVREEQRGQKKTSCV